jgi:hypothetical protein
MEHLGVGDRCRRFGKYKWQVQGIGGEDPNEKSWPKQLKMGTGAKAWPY